MIKLDSVGLVHYLGDYVEYLVYLLSRRKAGLQTVELLRKVLYRVEELVYIGIEGNYDIYLYYLTKKFPALKLSSCTKVEKTEDRGDIEHIDHGSEYTEDEYLIHLGFAKLDVLLIKLALLSCFAVEDLNDLHSRKVFREEDVDVGRAVLYLTVSAAREFTEYHRKENDEGNETENYERQHIVEHQHRPENAHDYEHILDEVDENVRKGDRDGVGVVGNSSNECSDGDLIELIVREALNVMEEILTDARNYLLSRLL